MIIYYSMILWVLLMWMINGSQKTIILPFADGYHNFSFTHIRTSVAIATFAYITFWIAIRTSFGDTYAYIITFKQTKTGFDEIINVILNQPKGVGFHLFSSIFKTYVSETYLIWSTFLAFISCGCVAYGFTRYSPNFFLSTLIYILSGSFAWAMNGVRQFICVTILFACTKLLLRKKWILLIGIVLALSTIHQTCLILLPIYFIVQQKPWSKMMIFSILFTCAFVCIPGIFTSAMATALQGSDYAGAVDKFGSGVNPIRTTFFSIPAVLAFYYRKQLAQHGNQLLNICINMSVITACLYCIGSVTSGILMGRLPIYCQLYSYILLPFIISICVPKNNRSLWNFCFIFLYFIFFTYQSAQYFYQSDLTGILK